jgi:hypothetical protein
MSLITYEQVRPWAAAIKEAVLKRSMPPWPATAPPGHFAKDGRLTDQQIDVIRTWANSGAAAGDRKDAPPPRRFPEIWEMGRPDLMLTLPRTQRIPGNGRELWKYVYFDKEFDQDTWIRGLEIHPGNYNRVHHANIQVVTAIGSGPVDWSSLEQDVEAPQNDPPKLIGMEMVQIHVGLPGQFSLETAPGTAILIPKHSRIRMNIHYAPSQTPETDHTEVGLYFANGRIEKQWRLQYGGPGESLLIPAAVSRLEIRNTTKIQAAITVHQIGCHMHIRGKTYRVTAELPDGRFIELLNVPAYNFHWQFLYTFAHPIRLPAGTVLHDAATFDNSAGNPFVMEYDTPNREVRFGNRTVDEMMTSYILHTVDN